MPEKRNIFDDIYEVVALVPPGRVTTYGAIARYLKIKSARTVGWGLNALSGRLDIPAHRVVNSKGELTGSGSFDSNRPMADLLAQEGVLVKENRIPEFKTKFWDPSEEL